MASERKEAVCGLPWFGSKPEERIFRGLGYACVYAAGTEKGRPLKVGWTGDAKRHLSDLEIAHWRPLQVHEIAWTAGAPVARRLEAEIVRLLRAGKRHLHGDWYDVPVDMMLPVFQVATDNLKVPTFTHAEMLARVGQARERQIAYALADAGLSPYEL